MSAQVAILPTTYHTAEKQIREALRLLNYCPQREKILLKPNLVAVPRWLPLGGIPRAAITDLRFVEALLRVFDGYEITIAEGTPARDTDEVLRKTGVTTLAHRYGAQVINLDKAERVFPFVATCGRPQPNAPSPVQFRGLFDRLPIVHQSQSVPSEWLLVPFVP